MLEQGSGRELNEGLVTDLQMQVSAQTLRWQTLYIMSQSLAVSLGTLGSHGKLEGRRGSLRLV